jgi:hypothetical protein
MHFGPIGAENIFSFQNVIPAGENDPEIQNTNLSQAFFLSFCGT